MCALHLGEDDNANADSESILFQWSEHFKTAIEHLNG